MKILRFILPLTIILFLTGCLDEDVKIQKDGSGTMSMDMDMGDVLQQALSAMGNGSDGGQITPAAFEKLGLRKIDSTVYLKSIVDTSTKLSAADKAALAPGTIHIKCDLVSGNIIFKVHSNFPFSSQENLQRIYSAMSNGSFLSNADVMKELGGGGQAPDPGMFNGIFDYTCKNGVFSKKLNADKWKALQDDPTMAQAKTASSMGMKMDIKYTNTFHFPHPIKKIDNPLGKLSEDKQTVTFNFNLFDLFDHADQFSYNIEY